MGERDSRSRKSTEISNLSEFEMDENIVTEDPIEEEKEEGNLA